MRDLHRSILWLTAALIGTGVIAWLYPRVNPLFDIALEVDRATAKATALEQLAQLEEPIEDAYVVGVFQPDPALERRLQHLSRTGGQQPVRDSALREDTLAWVFNVYDGDARPGEWSQRAEISLSGDVMALQLRIPEEEGGEAPSEGEARERAAAFLTQQGLDHLPLEDEPTIRRKQTGERLDLAVRYRFRGPLVDEVPHGIEVLFAGDRLAGFRRWYDDPDREDVIAELSQLSLAGTGIMLLGFVMVAVLTVPFLKRYHDGQLGVRRGVQIFLICLGACLFGMLLVGPGMTENSNWGSVSRKQNTLIMGAVMALFGFVVPATSVAMAWPLGEWWSRGRWPQKLASFDALMRGHWQNAAVAHASARGVGLGVATVAACLLLFLLLRPLGAWPISVLTVHFMTSSPMPGLAILLLVVCGSIPALLFGYFLLPSWAEVRFGKVGPLIAVPVSLLFTTATLWNVVPMWAALSMWFLSALIFYAAFRFGDVLSMLIAGILVGLLPQVLPMLTAPSAWFQINGWFAVVATLLPLLVSVRFLGGQASDLTYHWDDVPAHVRRIAERERQRVELETARGIQQSILPELPPQLNGVEIAHTYLPASEVGGDFYDVLALDDGRLAVAVGDVAGHGVSSGLVMSMAKSALAVQVTFDPEVESVIGTLNRMVYQSARARLLTTLCYALVDPARNEVVYASAGHLFPYRVAQDGKVTPLEASSYPLGVRGEANALVRTCKIEPGDALFLYSDGLVEACAHSDHEQFGFDRLEASLSRHAGYAPQQMRDAVLADVDEFTGQAPQEDDLTVLVLRLPA